MKFVPKIDVWEATEGKKANTYFYEACEWIADRYPDLQYKLNTDRTGVIEYMKKIIIHIPQRHIRERDYPIDIAYNKQLIKSVNGWGRSFHSIMIGAVVVPRGKWYTYDKKRNKRSANGVPFIDYRSAIIIPTIHELTHRVQKIMGWNTGEAETTKNEFLFIEKEYPEMIEQTDLLYHDEVYSKKCIGGSIVKYKTHQISVFESDDSHRYINQLTADDVDSIKWTKVKKTLHQSIKYEYKHFNLFSQYGGGFKLIDLKNHRSFNFNKKGEATLWLALYMKNSS